MKKGKLIKKGNDWIIQSDEIKNEMRVPFGFELTEDMHEKDIEFESKGGPVSCIRYANKTYKKVDNLRNTSQDNKKNNNDKPQYTSKNIKSPSDSSNEYEDAIIVKENNEYYLKYNDGSKKKIHKGFVNLSIIEKVKGIIAVKVKRSGWKLESLLYNNIELVKETGAANNPNVRNNQPQARQPAHAPYNFVPLNDTVVETLIQYKDENGKTGIPPFDRFVEGHHSGFIDLKIEAKTKVFIGSGSSETGNYNFFSPNGIPRIPGSSLRGMVRTLVEICSWGQFKFFEDKQLFYRTFEDSSMGKDFYRKRMVGKHGQPKVRAGYLTKDGRNYKIIPALCNPALCDTEFYRINYDKGDKEIKYIGKLYPFNEKIVYFKPVKVKNQSQHHGGKNLHYPRLDSVSDTHDPSKYPVKGNLIASGDIYNKKHLHWVINEPDLSDTLKYKNVSKDVINTYNEDASRKAEKPDPNDNNPDPKKKKKISFDVLSRLKTQDQVPCFYLEEDGAVTAIGHTPYFRLPYQNKIGDLLPQAHKDFNGIDIPTAIFGNESTDDEGAGFAGRVYFEDAVCKSNCNSREATTHRGQATAISPKPTSFQLYLKQDSIDVKKENLKHYDSEGARLRGNKLYWHKTHDSNNADKLQFNNTRIRFTNLNNVELGALLFALELPEGCCHKIGMGKPQGLGSIKITPTLYFTDHQKKYASFTAVMHYKSKHEEDINSLKKVFENYINEHPGIDNSLSSLWDHDRLKQLKALLNWKNPPKNTGYMPLMVRTGRRKADGTPEEKINPQYKQRLILPDADKVK